MKMTVIVPKRFLKLPEVLERVIENTLDGAAENVREDFLVTTQTWEHKPEFAIVKKPGDRWIGTDDKIYGILNEGARPHIIRAKNGPGLRFYATGFKPKSRVQQIVSRKGKAANKDFRTPVVVHHPGVEKRMWNRVIKKKWDKMLPTILQRAIDAEVNF